MRVLAMPSKPVGGAGGKPEKGKKAAPDRKREAKTIQLPRDTVYWLSLIAAFQNKSLAEVLDPIARPFAREALKGLGTDPDQVWARYLQQEEGESKPA